MMESRTSQLLPRICIKNLCAFVLTMLLLRVWNLDHACVYSPHPAMSMDVHCDRGAPVLSESVKEMWIFSVETLEDSSQAS